MVVAKFDIVSPNADTVLTLTNDGNTIGTGSNFLLVTKGATNLFSIRGDGNVGIGALAASQRLYVSGDIRFTNALVNDIVVSVVTSGAAAQGINVGGLLVSNNYADVSAVATNGAYIKGILRVGNTTDMYSSSIQTNGAISASSAVTSEAYLQVKAATAPAAATNFCRIALRSSDNALVAVMPSGNVRTLATN
jgi:hypothetical protein